MRCCIKSIIVISIYEVFFYSQPARTNTRNIYYSYMYIDGQQNFLLSLKRDIILVQRPSPKTMLSKELNAPTEHTAKSWIK